MKPSLDQDKRNKISLFILHISLSEIIPTLDKCSN